MTTSRALFLLQTWDVGGVETSFFGYAQDYRLSQQALKLLVLKVHTFLAL